MKKDSKTNYFKYVVLAAVLIIPFMYSFFYLKAYWNPYGKGNIDNIPVAIINADKGDKGLALVNSIKDKKKLKLSVVSSTKATKGLYDGDYYAVITIPEDFTSNMESASSTNKRHALITYSPNQKSNYLASQIINNVVNVVEKNLDNEVNSTIVKNLSETVEEVPEKLDTISDGFTQLKEGTSKLSEGSKTLTNGTNSLALNYVKFNDGVKSVKDATDTLNTATEQFKTLGSSLTELTSGVSTLKSGSDYFTGNFNNYKEGVETTLVYTENMANYIKATVCPVKTKDPNDQATQLCAIAEGLTTGKAEYGGYSTINYLKASGVKLKEGNVTVNTGINTLNTKVSGLSCVTEKLSTLQNGIKTLNNGANTLYTSSLQIQNGINTLNTGANTLTNGITTLDSSVKSAKDELDSNIETTKKEVRKVSGLSNYSKEPVKIKTKEVNKVSSYGTAFSPFFISIALWVGSLMMFIVLYYDKAERFGVLGINSTKRVKRTLLYHLLATIAAIVLGLSLQLLLDFTITNVFLYYIAIIITSNAFMAIVEFLIGNFSDIGKFIALIILVLQLAAAGGTFPIETVTKGFRWMNSFLPMTYTVKLLREPLVSIESNLLTKNLLIVISIFIVFFIINIVTDIIKEKKEGNR